MFGPNTIYDEIAKIKAEHEAAEAEAETRVAAKAEVAAEVVAEKRLEMDSILAGRIHLFRNYSFFHWLSQLLFFSKKQTRFSYF